MGWKRKSLIGRRSSSISGAACAHYRAEGKLHDRQNHMLGRGASEYVAGRRGMRARAVEAWDRTRKDQAKRLEGKNNHINLSSSVI